MSRIMMKNKYCASLILDTRNYQEPIESLIGEIKSKMESVGCEVESIKNLGMHAFTRVVNRKFPEGIYVRFFFESLPKCVKELKDKFVLDKRVSRIFIESK